MIDTRLDDVVREGHLAGGILLGLVVGTAIGVVESRAHRRGGRARPAAGVTLSLLAAGGAFACTPDTELALGVLGAVVGAGAAWVAFGLAWWWPATVVTGSLVVVAVTDGWSRASAVVGTLAVAVLHQGGQALLHRDAPAVVVLPIAAVGVAMCSRVAGLADTARAALAVAVPTLVVATVAAVAADRMTRGARGRQTAGVRQPPREPAP